MELTLLIEDPANASIASLAAEAAAKLAAGRTGAAAQSGASTADEQRSLWISPCPVSVKMRLFCLPYAGGISENVFARCGCCFAS